MEPANKKLKISINLQSLPLNVIVKILSFLPLNDVKQLSLINSTFYSIVSNFLKNRTFLYVTKQNENELAGATINKEIKEIAFKGVIKKENVAKILESNKECASKVSFYKADLNFIKVECSTLVNWLKNFEYSLITLNTLNLDITFDISCSTQQVTLQNLKKLSCSDTVLQIISAPILLDVRIFSTDEIKQKTIENINSFIARHHTIKKLVYKVFCGDDDRVMNTDFNLKQLELSHLSIAEFRYNPEHILNILKSQKKIVWLQIEDGNIVSDDFGWTRKFEPIFEEIASMKFLNKLIIEVPTVKLLKKLQKIQSLQRLSVSSITFDVLNEFLSMEFPNIIKLAIENIEGLDAKKIPLTREHIWMIGSNFKRLQSLKFDVAPKSVVDSMIKHVSNLKEIKIFHSMDTVKKIKARDEEAVVLAKSNLIKIICEHEDFKNRIMPIVRASPHLKHVKIYWSKKDTPIMTNIFEVLENCPAIEMVEFKYNGIYCKEDAIPFKSHFHLSYNNSNFQVIISRKNGNIRCGKMI